MSILSSECTGSGLIRGFGAARPSLGPFLGWGPIR